MTKVGINKKAIIWAIFLLVLASIGLQQTFFAKAVAPLCSTTTITVTSMSAPVFYIDKDTTPLLDSGYVSYRINTGASGSFTDLWVKADTFSDTSKLNIATGVEDGYFHVGPTGVNTNKDVYLYFKGAVSASAQSFQLHLYNGHPTYGGSETCYTTQSFSSVEDTQQTNSNKVTSVVHDAPYIGGTMTITVDGETGVMNGGGIFNYTPASVSTWPADCYVLYDTKNELLSGGNTGTFNDGLYLSGLNTANTVYKITYYFIAACVTTSPTTVTPLNNISNGQIKHTAVDTTTYTSIAPIDPATNALTMTKSASPTTSTSGTTVTYSISVANTSANAISLDDFQDILPSSPANGTYITNTSAYDNDISDASPATSISNPNISGQTLTWTGVFSVPGNKTGRLTFNATIPSTQGIYTNSAKGHVGATQIDSTLSTTDNSLATATHSVGTPNLSTSTKTVTDLNGGSVLPDDILRYTVNVINSGFINGTGINVTDNIDNDTQNLTNVVIGASSTNCGGSYVNSSTSSALNITNLSANASSTCSITFDVTVKSNASDGASVTNSATISAATQGGSGGTPSSTTLTVHRYPNLVVTKTENDADNIVSPSQVITYTVTITNDGYANATGVSLADTVSGSISSISNITKSNCGGSYSDTSSGSNVTISNLRVNQSNACTVTYDVTVSSGATSGTISNAVNVGAASEGGNDPSPVSATNLTIIASPPNLSVSASENDADNIVTPGQTVGYTITVSNSGQTAATTSLVSVIPTGMGTPTSIAYSNCGSPSSGYSAPNLTFSSLSIAANNGTCTITFNTAVNTPINEGTTLTLTADAAQASQGGNDPAITSASTLTVDATPNLSTTTLGVVDNNGGTVEPGDTLTYTLTIKNTGDGQGTGINVSDTVDTDTTLLPGTVSFSNCGGSYSNTTNSTALTVSNITTSVGTNCVITFQVTVQTPKNEGTPITGSATVSSASQGGSGASPAATTLFVDATPNLSTSTLTVTDLNSGTVEPGDTLKYTLTLKNTGNGLGTGIDISELADTDTTLAPLSVTLLNCGSSISNTTTSTTVQLANLEVAVGTNCVITFEVTVQSPKNEGTPITGSASVTSADEGGPGASPTASTLLVDATPNLSTATIGVVDNNGGTVEPGDTLTYTLTIPNTGNGDASGVEVTNTVNSHVTLNTGSLSFSSCGSGSDNGSTSSGLSLNNIQVIVGVNCVITYQVVIDSPLDEGTLITESAAVSSADEGGPGATPSAPNLIIDATPDLSTSTMDVVDGNGGTVEPGDTLTYSITIKNTGNGTGTGISLTQLMDSHIVMVPSSIIFTNCGSSYADNSTTGGLSIADLETAVGTDCIITFDATVNSPLNEGTTINSSATVGAATEGGPGASLSESALIVDATPDLAVGITENDSDNLVSAGQMVNMEITITNSGNGDATGISATHTLTGPIEAISSLNSTGCGGSVSVNNTSTSVTATSIDIPVGTTCTITFTIKVDSAALGGQTIDNQVDVSAAIEGGADPAVANASQLTVASLPSAEFTKKVTAIEQIGITGVDVTYTFTIKSTGNAPLTNIQITDSLASLLNADVSYVESHTTVTDSFQTTPTVSTAYNGQAHTSLFSGTLTGITLTAAGQGNDTAALTLKIRFNRTPGADIEPNSATLTADGGISLVSDSDGALDSSHDSDPLNDPAVADIKDSDNDGVIDTMESHTGDRDGDGIPDDEDYDPTGYFYCQKTGKIISGGSVTASGPGQVTFIQNGGSGYYQFYTDGTPGLYTMTVTYPAGTSASTDRLAQSSPLDPTGQPNPYVIGSGEYAHTGYLANGSAAANPFYTTFTLEAGDPWIFNNNIPLTNCGTLTKTGINILWSLLAAVTLGGGALFIFRRKNTFPKISASSEVSDTVVAPLEVVAPVTETEPPTFEPEKKIVKRTRKKKKKSKPSE